MTAPRRPARTRTRPPPAKRVCVLDLACAPAARSRREIPGLSASKKPTPYETCKHAAGGEAAVARPLQRPAPTPVRAPPRPPRSPPDSQPASAYGSAIGPAVLRAPEVARAMQRAGERPSGASDAGSDASSWHSGSEFAGPSGASTPAPGLRRPSPVQAHSPRQLACCCTSACL